MKKNTHMKDVPLRRECFWASCIHRPLRNLLPEGFIHGAQLPGHSEAKVVIVLGIQMPLNLTVDFGIIHMRLNFQACTMKKLQGHRGFYSDFKGRPWGPGNM
jgi:hypothetical protein